MDDNDYDDLIWYKKKYGLRIKERGIKNVKNLIRRPTLNEWVIFICILMCLTLTFLYKVQIKNCQEQVDDIFTYPYKYSQYFNTYQQFQNEFNKSKGNTEFIPLPLQSIQGLLS